MRIRAATVLLASMGALCAAQEVLYIDLTSVPQRTELRRPTAPPPKCNNEGQCTVAGSSVGGGVGDGAEDYRDPRALRVSVTSLDSIEYSKNTPVEVEFKLENAGTVPLEVPVSPHLSDLQPADAAEKFDYQSLSLLLQHNLTKALVLYGDPAHPGTLLLLKPGEWIRVRGRTEFTMSDKQWTEAYAAGEKWVIGEFWLRRVTFVPQPGGSFTNVENLYPRHLAGPAIMVRFQPTHRGAE
jgi:hypothetical protein